MLEKNLKYKKERKEKPKYKLIIAKLTTGYEKQSWNERDKLFRMKN